MSKTILAAMAIACAALAGCNGAAPETNQSTNQTVARLVAEPDAPELPPVPMTADQIRRALPGHYIDESPYDCDEGPILIRADGSFEATAFWGVVGGPAEIADGRILFDDHGAPEHFRRAILLYRDRRGHLFYRYEGESGDPRPLRLAPIASAPPRGSCGNGGNATG